MSFWKGIKNKAKIGVGAVGFFLFGWASWWGYSEYNIEDYNKYVNVYERSLEKGCFIGDTGLNNEPRSKLLSLMKDDCHDVFIMGDLIYPVGLRDERDKQFYDKFAPFLNFNTHVVLGNHERYSTRQTQIWSTLADRNDFYFPNHFWGVVYKDSCVLGFESAIYTTAFKGQPEKDQNTFIKSFLSDSRCTNKIMIVISHHPYKSSGKHGNSSGRLEEVYNDLIIGNVNFSIAGHDHNLSDEGIYKNTRVMVSGSGAKLRDCGKLNVNSKCYEKYGFIKLTKNFKPVFVMLGKNE